jgi:hypothetical protein
MENLRQMSEKTCKSPSSSPSSHHVIPMRHIRVMLYSGVKVHAYAGRLRCLSKRREESILVSHMLPLKQTLSRLWPAFTKLRHERMLRQTIDSRAGSINRRWTGLVAIGETSVGLTG